MPNVQVININSAQALATWQQDETTQEARKFTEYEAFSELAFAFRPVDIRAKAVMGMPFDLVRGGKDIKETPDGKRIVSLLAPKLYQIEAALCIYAAAYLLKDINPSNVPQPRWVAPESIAPNFSASTGLVDFTRTYTDENGNSITRPVALDEIIYIWQPIINADIGPGVAPLTVALKAAGVLDSIDEQVELFFRGGMQRKHVLLIDKGALPEKKDRDALESRWSRFIRSFRAALALPASINPSPIGSDINATEATSLTEQKRQDLCVALGVPYTMIQAMAANNAVSYTDWVELYDLTVLPEWAFIAPALNTQWLIPDEDCEIVVKAERLQAYQESELAKAQRLAALIPAGSYVLTQDEARKMIGKEPIKAEQITAPVAPVESVADAGKSLPLMPQSDAARLDRERWQRKALNALVAGKPAGVSFASDTIDVVEHASITAALADVTTADEVKAVFARRPDAEMTAADVVRAIDEARMALQQAGK